MNSYYLKDLLEIKNGSDHKHLKDGNIPVYGSGGLMRMVDTHIYEDESILLPRKGTLSNIQYTNKPFWTVDTLYYTIVNKEKAVPYYLYHYLKRLDLSNLNSGTGVPSMTFGAYYGVKISLPSLPTQQKIAAVLSVLDDKIEVNNKINVELEAMAKTLYDYWFVQFEFPNVEGKPYKSSGGKMVYNPTLKREIPEGWDDTKLGELTNLVRGVSYNKDDIKIEGEKEVLPILRATNIVKNKVDISDPVIVPSRLVSDEQILNPFDILITMSSGSIDHIGKNGFYLHKERVSFGAFCAKIVPVNNYKFYIYNYLQSDFVSVTIKNECLGTNINNLNSSLVNSFRIVNPDFKILEAYNKIVEPIFFKIKLNTQQNQELAQLRDWLLPMLMNGQVTVGEVRIGDRINEYANSEVSHEKLVAETFGEYLPKKQHNINDINKELAALIYLMNYGLGANYGNVAVQKAVYNSSVITPNLYSKKHDFINYNFGTFSKGLADDLSHNPYLKTKKINGFEVYEIEPSKKNEILNVLSSAENKDFVSSINKLIDLYRLPFINKETNKMELLNTVLKIHSDLKTTDIEIIYQAMKDWKIKQDKYSTKAEKFSKQDTQQMIELLLRNNILR